ncbi:MAG: hypothetical protein JSS53_04980 [Proteobacteria bacterium]|nr:hypothetical protein [Pseudomonadota bacterium]
MLNRLYGFLSALFSSLLLIQVGYANDEATRGSGITWGNVSGNVLEPASMLKHLAYVGCYTIGIALLLSALLQFVQHRRNPMQVRLIQPVTLFLFGLALILVPIISKLSPSSGAL